MTSYRSLLWPNLQFSSRLTTKESPPDHLGCTIGSGVVELVGIEVYSIEKGPVQGEIFPERASVSKSEHQCNRTLILRKNEDFTID